MNKKAKIYLYYLYVSVLIINLSTLLGGIKHHETWRIIIGSIALALIIVTLILTAVGYKSNEEERIS